MFAQLQYPLHSGRIAGVWGRAFICFMGLLVTAVSITGLVIWWRKRLARLSSRARAPVFPREQPMLLPGQETALYSGSASESPRSAATN